MSSLNPTTPFSFAVITDLHLAGPPHPKYDAETWGTHADRFSRCIASSSAGSRSSDLILVLGDLHIDAFDPSLIDGAPPIHAVAGNHEVGEQRARLRERFPDDFQIDGVVSDYYAFAHKGVRFIAVCNAGSGGDHIGHLTSSDIVPRGQCEWLEEELSGPEPCKIIYSHVPPEPDGADRDMYMGRNDSRYFNDLIERFQPAALFFGHQHLPTRIHRVGPSQVCIARSCAWNFGGAELGYLYVTVEDSGVVIEDVIVPSEKGARE